MPIYDISGPRSGGPSAKKAPQTPQYRLPIVGGVILAVLLLVIVVAWSLFNGHNGSAPIDTSRRMVVQHDPSSPTDLTTESPKTPQGTDAIKSTHNTNSANPGQ